MKAVVFDGKDFVRIVEVARPKLEDPRDAIVRITHASICGSDLNILNGKIPVEENAIMGHEGVGIVEEAGLEVKRVKVGDRVLISYSVQCGECERCMEGLPVFCLKGGMLGHGEKWGGYGGTHAEYIRIPFADANLFPIPSTLSEEQAIFVGDILSTGYQANEYGEVERGDFVTVFGAGPVGLCAIHTGRLFGPKTIAAVDVIDYRLEAAKRLGADIVINALENDPVQKVLELTQGRGADVAIEAVGRPETFEACFNCVRLAGRISIVGVFEFDKIGISLRQMLRRNLQIRAGRVNLVNVYKLFSLIENRKLNPTLLITHRFSLEEAEKAYEMFRSKSDGVVKVILRP